MRAWFSTRGEDAFTGWFPRCYGCKRLLQPAKYAWCIRPTDGRAFHLACAVLLTIVRVDWKVIVPSNVLPPMPRNGNGGPSS